MSDPESRSKHARAGLPGRALRERLLPPGQESREEAIRSELRGLADHIRALRQELRDLSRGPDEPGRGEAALPRRAGSASRREYLRRSLRNGGPRS